LGLLGTVLSAQVLDRNKIVDLYTNQHKTIKQIAKELGTRRRLVSKTLKEAGVELRHRRNTNKDTNSVNLQVWFSGKDKELAEMVRDWLYEQKVIDKPTNYEFVKYALQHVIVDVVALIKTKQNLDTIQKALRVRGGRRGKP